ncbi:MAG TPA: magnesium transporter CorA family protein [Acetobacteraceae bacterium]|nr:magnesium transporter CorA family protein [Acetobacteraceae bacterium]
MLTAFTYRDGMLHRILEPLSEAVWIDLLEPTPDEAERVARETGLAIPTEADINEIESSSRLATRDDTLYLSMPLVVHLDDEPRSVSFGFVLSRDRLITVRFATSRVFEQFIAQHAMPASSGSHVMVALLEAVVDRQADALEQVKADLENISHRIFAADMVAASGRKREDRMLRATLVTLGRVGDLVSHIRESQVSAGRIVPYVETAAEAWLPPELHPRLQTLQRDIASLNDYDTHLNDKLQFLLDATLGFINIAQNNVMKVLTVASVVGIPPVLVAGIYGMNFKSIPEYDWPWGYAYGLAVIVLTAIIPLAIFKWRNWI